MEKGDRGGLLSAGGILSIIVGVLEAVAGGFLIASVLLTSGEWELALPLVPRFGDFGVISFDPTPVLIAGIVVLVLGILAISGGVSALKRSSFGLAIVGALCAFLPVNILGLLALIFVSLGSSEFRAEET
ncbi:MAG TPA: hypothetical protein ENL12_02135 [Dehalococcoidia bacterium]|nr:hypothetical protein [Dehalococcoidia bacterium]